MKLFRFSLLAIIIFGSIATAQAATDPNSATDPTVNDLQGSNCVVTKQRPPAPKPGETPAPFNPDLGYNQVKRCLPESNFETGSLLDFVSVVLYYFSIIVGFLAVLGLIVSGIMYITAGSDPDKALKARRNIVWILFGILLYIFALFILPYTRSILVNEILWPFGPFLPNR